MYLVGAVGALAVDPFAGRGLAEHSVSPVRGCRAGLKGRKGDRGSPRVTARRLQGLNRSGSAGALWIARPDEIGIGHDHPSTLRSCGDGEQSSKEHGDKPAELTLEL
jgi:hypothetical protein